MKLSLEDAIAIVQCKPAAYVLQAAAKNYLDKGSCRDLKKRFKDHKADRVSRIKNRRPLELVYFDMLDAFSEARKRENYFKTGTGRRLLDDHIHRQNKYS